MARSNAVTYLLGTRFHRMSYVEFGNPAAPAVLCVHGLTRNGRDFDPLAEALADRFHVICPDLPGRGKSDWLAEPMAYQPPSYVIALAHLLAALGKPVAWVGTSLGGICGMMTAAAQGAPVTRLVLNDIGPHIPAAALQRIRTYMLEAPERFPNMAALQAHLRLIHAPFGPLTDAQWGFLARHSARAVLGDTGGASAGGASAGGALAMHYDPRIIEPMRNPVQLDVDLWPVWERIEIPRLVIRGASSDLLLPDTYERMLEEGAQGHVVADAGHAPALMDEATIAVIRAFLLKT
jgi:pimeloyl-ACP methyl ester carboxylesterase